VTPRDPADRFRRCHPPRGKKNSKGAAYLRQIEAATSAPNWLDQIDAPCPDRLNPRSSRVGTVGGNRRLPGQPESPGDVGGLANPDPRSRLHRGRGRNGGLPDTESGRRIARVRAVHPPVYAQGLAETGRASRQVPRWDARLERSTPGTGEILPRHYLTGPHQHGGGGTSREADQVHAEMHPVREIHVHVSRRAEHDGGPGSPSPERVRGRVSGPGVGLYLGEPHGDLAIRRRVRQHAPE
jgi:hypothetical protein